MLSVILRATLFLTPRHCLRAQANKDGGSWIVIPTPKEVGVTVFKASASFFKRLARHKCRLAWLRAQKLRDSLRIATSCGNLVEKCSARLPRRRARVTLPSR